MNVEILKGKILTRCYKDGNDQIYFVSNDGKTFRQYHSQNCCESVIIEDINGTLDDLIGTPILIAEESTNKNPEGFITNNHEPSHTWTFYRFMTMKGWVIIRWHGKSSGFYSESVNFEEVK